VVNKSVLLPTNVIGTTLSAHVVEARGRENR
jgi:hypothetical protein